MTTKTVDRFTVPVECREADHSGPGRLVGTILETGRVASDRQEVFTPGSPIFPSVGVELFRGHRGKSVMTFDPIVDGSTIRIDARLPDNELGRQVATEVRSGERSRCLSSSYHCLKRGCRELESCGRRWSKLWRWSEKARTRKRRQRSESVQVGGIGTHGNDHFVRTARGIGR